MIVVKRIFSNNKRLAYYISTSAIRSTDDPKKTLEIVDAMKTEKETKKRKKTKSLIYPEKVVSEEEKKKAKEDLSNLLKNMSVEDERVDRKSTDMFMNYVLPEQKEKKRKVKLKGGLVSQLFEAAENLTKNMGEDKEKTKIDLFSQIEQMQITLEEPEPIFAPVGDSDLSNETVRRLLQGLINSKRLQIFEDGVKSEEIKLNIWEKLEEEELAYRSLQPPRNQFEEWIQWTDQGKLWHFPIDNDQGREKEAETDFTKHIFLDEYLEPWCPKKGPLRKFMELVLVGLSKNPHLTVEKKEEHILWYKEYFEKKKELLQELGAIEPTREIEEAKGAQETVEQPQ